MEHQFLEHEILSCADEKLDATALEGTTIPDGECHDVQQIYDLLGKNLINEQCFFGTQTDYTQGRVEAYQPSIF